MSRSVTNLQFSSLFCTTCQALAACLSHHPKVKHSVVLQVLRKLPVNLVISVLSASAIPFPVQLSQIPPHLHSAATQAAFPDIRANGSLELDASAIGTPSSCIVLAAYQNLLEGSQQSTDLLRISSPLAHTYSAATASPLIANLMIALDGALRIAPMHVHLAKCTLAGPQYMRLLPEALESNPRLQSLKMHLPRMHLEDALRIAALSHQLTRLTQVRSLHVVNQMRAKHTAPLFSALQQLTNLTELTLTHLHACALDFLSSLVNLASLDITSDFRQLATALAHMTALSKMTALSRLAVLHALYDESHEFNQVHNMESFDCIPNGIKKLSSRHDLEILTCYA